MVKAGFRFKEGSHALLLIRVCKTKAKKNQLRSDNRSSNQDHTRIQMADLTNRPVQAPFEAIIEAVFFAAARRSAAGKTLFTRPSSFASCAPIICPVYISSLAWAFPIRRESLCVPPNPGIIPRLISGCPNLASSEA